MPVRPLGGTSTGTVAPTTPALGSMAAPGTTAGNHLAPTSIFLSTSGHMGATYRVRHVVEGSDLIDPTLVYANVRRLSNRLQAGPNPITVRCSIEVPGQTLPMPLHTPLGARDLVLAAGQSAAFRGTGIRLPVGAVFYTRTYVSVTTSGEQWPLGRTTQPGDGEGNNSSATPTDLTTSGTVPTAFAFAYSPVAIVGRRTSATKSVGLVGDSIISGQGDTPNDMGYAVRAFDTANIPWVRVSVPGEKASEFAADPWLRAPLLRGVDAILCHYGRNDITGGRTLTQMQADLLTTWGVLAAFAPVTQGTVTPQSTSTDSFATPGNQTTVSTNGLRNQLNAWLRAGAPISGGAAVAVGTGGALVAGTAGHPLKAVVELTDAVESARDSGIWKAAYTSDGLHPLPAGVTAMTAALAAASL